MPTSATPHGTLICTEFRRLLDLAVQHPELGRDLPILAHKKDGKQGKNPIHRHRDVDYDNRCMTMGSEMATSDKWQSEIESRELNLNILLNNLYILDSDSPAASAYIEVLKAKFPEDFARCPIQSTSHGMHYFFLRPVEHCDHFNGARAFARTPEDAAEFKTASPDRKKELKMELDCCTVTSNGTRGNINVWPSSGKQWVRRMGTTAPGDVMPRQMSTALYCSLDATFIGKRAIPAPAPTRPGHVQQSARPAPAQRAAQLPCPIVTPKQQVYVDALVLRSRSTTSGTRSVVPEAITWTSHNQARITTSKCSGGRRLCLADDTHIADGDNAVVSIAADGNMVYYCFSAACRRSKQPVIVPLSVVIQVGKADFKRNPAASIVVMRRNLKLAMPIYDHIMKTCASNKGTWLDSDSADLAIRHIDAIKDGRLVRDTNSLSTYLFEGHKFNELPADAADALYNPVSSGLKEIFRDLMHRGNGIEASLRGDFDGHGDDYKFFETEHELVNTAIRALPKRAIDALKQALVDRKVVLAAGEAVLEECNSVVEDSMQRAHTQLGNLGPGPMIQRHLLPRITVPLQLDASPHLMCFTNGVLEMDTGVFRDGTTADLITLSTGYAYSGSMDDVPQLVLDTMAQVYPVESERECARLWFAYNMFGEAPCKLMAIHTDTVKGNNGKSTILGLLCKAMGDGGSGDGYAISMDDNRLLQGTKSQDPNSHSDQERQLKAKRCVFLDEGSKDRGINIKARTNGGNTKKTARACGSATRKGDVYYETAKFNLACNKGDVPVFDQEDGAQQRRLLFIKYRAVFADDPRQWKADNPDHADPAWVYQENGSIADDLKHPEMLSGIINWLLKPYQVLASRPEGMLIHQSDIPDSLRAFKQDTLTAQATPSDLLAVMEDHQKTHYENVGIASTASGEQIHTDIITLQQFKETLSQTSAEYRGLVEEARSKADFNKCVSAVFTSLPGFVREKQPTKATSHLYRRFKNSLSGYRRRRVSEFSGVNVEAACSSGIHNLEQNCPTLGDTSSRLGQKRTHNEAGL